MAISKNYPPVCCKQALLACCLARMLESLLMLRICVLAFLLIFPPGFLLAADCNLAAVNFPRAGCGFVERGINIKALRFARIDAILENDSAMLFGSARFDLSAAQIFDTKNEGCRHENEISDTYEAGDEVAFIADPRNQRKIKYLWLLTCAITQPR